MTIQEEIHLLETKLAATEDLKEQAEVILEILKKLQSIKANAEVTEPYIAKLEQLAKTLNTPKYKGWSLYFSAILKYRETAYDNASIYFEQALSIFQTINYRTGCSEVHNHWGYVYFAKSNYNMAMEHYQKALDISVEDGDQKGISRGYIDMGNLITRQGNYPVALQFHLKGLKIREELGDKKALSVSYQNLANVYALLSIMRKAFV